MNNKLANLIDKAALGDLDAVAAIGIGYYKGTFGTPNYEKALKWTSYAAKKGHKEAIAILEDIKKML